MGPREFQSHCSQDQTSASLPDARISYLLFDLPSQAAPVRSISPPFFVTDCHLGVGIWHKVALFSLHDRLIVRSIPTIIPFLSLDNPYTRFSFFNTKRENNNG